MPAPPGITRFVMVSAIGVDAPLPDDTGTGLEGVRRGEARRRRGAAASGLDWTILRPGRLTDDAATGLVALGPDVERGEIPRADVAATVAAVLDDDRTIGKQWNLVGGQIPVPDAVSAAVENG